jgi:hypothetical protein
MSAPALSAVFRKVIGSAVAAFIGALSGILAMLLFGWDDWRVCLFMIGIFVVPAWLLILLPLHVLLPRSSGFWRPSISIGFGAACAALVLTIYFAFSGIALLWLFLPIGVLVGSVTGFVGAAFARFYASPTA